MLSVLNIVFSKAALCLVESFNKDEIRQNSSGLADALNDTEHRWKTSETLTMFDSNL